MRHYASPTFWEKYQALPEAVRKLADKDFELLKVNPRHPSLRFKKIGSLRSARVGIHHRVLGVDVEDGVYWTWIGTHAEYDKIIA